MAHEIDMSNGRANVAIFSATGQNNAWHQLGQVLTEEAPIDVWKVEAGLNWEAAKTAVKYQVGDQILEIQDRQVIYRKDTNDHLGIVSPRFQIVQPGEVLEFFRDLTEVGGFKMETAGSLFGGRKIWAQAKTGENVRIKGVDEIKPYLLLATALDGTMATCGHFTTTRVVCNNTLRMAIGANGNNSQVRIPHITKFNADAVKEQLGIANETFQTFIENATKLADYKISKNDAIDFMAEQLKLETEIEDQQIDPMETSRELKNIIQLFNGNGIGSNLETAKGTAWGLVNAVTQYYDHEAGRRGDGSKAFDRAQLGDRAAFKVKVADALLEAA